MSDWADDQILRRGGPLGASFIMLVVGYLALLRDQFAADGYLDAADILGDLVELGDAHITNFR